MPEVNVSCTSNLIRQHFVSLCQGGELFAWGQNLHGQLGIGRLFASIPTPQVVEHLSGVPLVQISAGKAHSMALSMSGNIYSWGRNDLGQLGLGHTDGMELYFQVHIIKYIS